MRLTQKGVETKHSGPVIVDQPLRLTADRRVGPLSTERREDERNDLVAIVVGLGERSEGEVVRTRDQSVLATVGAMRARIVGFEHLEAGEEGAIRIQELDE